MIGRTITTSLLLLPLLAAAPADPHAIHAHLSAFTFDPPTHVSAGGAYPRLAHAFGTNKNLPAYRRCLDLAEKEASQIKDDEEDVYYLRNQIVMIAQDIEG